MKRSYLVWVLFLLALFVAAPVCAQDEIDEMESSIDDVSPGEWMDEGVVTGNVVSVDANAGTVIIATDEGNKTFSVVDGETILWKGIEDIELSGVTIGEEAEVGYYTDESGTLVASWVDVLVEEEAMPLEMEEDVEQE